MATAHVHGHVRVAARAKLNLHLAVLAREASGYHAIETVMHKITLADDVDVTLDASHNITVSCDVDVGPPEHNLAYRAATAYVAATSWRTGVAIRITKRIPAGGGLGGGSADAGAVLRALNTLAPSSLSTAQLLEIATPLGADVPFLTSTGAMALAWGRGERMLSLDPLPLRHVALALPRFRVATAEAYGWIAAGREHRHPTTPAVELHPWHLANWNELTPHRRNDFETVVAERHPTLLGIIATLKDGGAQMAGMTGSGSTVFGVFEAPPDRGKLEQATGCPVVITQTVTG